MSGANTAIATIIVARASPIRPDHERSDLPEDVAPPARALGIGALRRSRRRPAAGAASCDAVPADDIEIAAHETRTRGSNTVYSRSVIRLTNTNEMPTIRAKPCTTA